MEHNDCVSSGNRVCVIGPVFLQTMYYRSAGRVSGAPLLCRFFTSFLLLACVCFDAALLLFCGGGTG